MAKPKRERPPPEYSDPTPQRLAHAGTDLHDSWKDAVAKGQRPPPVRIITFLDHPLERMLTNRQISERQFDAGRKLRGYWERMGGAGRVGSIDWEALFASDPTTRYGGWKPGLDAWNFLAAVRHLGDIPSALVVSVACRGNTLESVCPDFGRHPAGTGFKVVQHQFRKHLSKLADFWGL
jgi:hypothetical protein